jgi:hypothetical protein
MIGIKAKELHFQSSSSSKKLKAKIRVNSRPTARPGGRVISGPI